MRLGEHPCSRLDRPLKRIPCMRRIRPGGLGFMRQEQHHAFPQLVRDGHPQFDAGSFAERMPQTVAPRRARQWPACCFASVAGRAEQKVRTASVSAAAMRD